jgi:DNA mismatch repair protein MutS
MTSVLSEYLKIYSEYSEKYGEKTAVLMCVGSFYECYGVDNESEKHGNAAEMAKILNIILTRKNKKLLRNSMQNPLMLGFPCLALNKYIPVLLNEDYTIVIVDQVKAGAGFRRSVSNVISPSTYIDSSEDDNYLVLVHVDRYQHIGMSAISVVTGSSVVHECHSDPADKDFPLDDALGFIKQYRPIEVVLSNDNKNGKDLKSHLELDDILCHVVEPDKDSNNIAYQNSVLGCAFDNESMLSNIEYLNLERMPHALLSYVLLIEFVHEHNPMLLRRMSRPELFVNDVHLTLSTSTLDQLNVTSQSKSKHTLFNVVNRCLTKAGKRLLLKRLTSPSADAKELVSRYDQIDEFGKLFGDNIDRLFKNITDIERLQRRLTVGIMVPSELAGLVASYDLILDLDDAIKSMNAKHFKCMATKQRIALQDFVSTCRHAFDMDMMPTCDCDSAAFNVGVFVKLDKAKAEVEREMETVRELLGAMSDYGIDGARIEQIPTVGFCVTVSSMRAKKIPSDSGMTIKHNKAIARISSSKVDIANGRLQELNEKLRLRTKQLYSKTLDYLSSYKETFEHVTHFVAETDVVRSNCRTKELYNYCRPDIVTSSVPNFVDAKDLRHAIMERIDDGNEYVPNDVAVGRAHNGMILYSMNSCGKTSLLRALGLSVIMAQAGCYVPASKFVLKPFKCIMTRILSRDNIMKGQSSFVAEMSELRAILKRATDASSLVLADEITHGTEHTSGSAIFVSSVETLAQRKVNFLFTTHLHNVYPFIKDIPNVRTCHLSVTFSANGTKSIVFERKLKEGPGGSIYGLEVCEYLDMDTKFLARAFQIRDKVTPEKDEKRSSIIKVSKYNRNKIIKCCESCGYAPRLPTDQPLHTHHIKERHLADDNGMIDGVHMDSVSNLAVLCERCHRQAHAN